MKQENLKKTWDKHALSTSKTYTFNVDKLKKSEDDNTQWIINLAGEKKYKRFLDAGCGIGNFVTLARELGLNAEGIDISKEAVKKGRQMGEKIKLGDIRKLPYKSNTFDIVLAEGSIEHFPETEKALKELSRVLRKKGVFIGNVPNRYTIFIFNKLLQQLLGLWKCGYEKSFSRKKLIALLENNGFEIKELKKSRIGIGKNFPLYSKVLRLIDDTLNIINLGGAHYYFYCIKK